MYVCIYLSLYLCMHVCMHVCMHACMHACLYVRTYVRMYVCMYVRTIDDIYSRHVIYKQAIFHSHVTNPRKGSMVRSLSPTGPLIIPSSNETWYCTIYMLSMEVLMGKSTKWASHVLWGYHPVCCFMESPKKHIPWWVTWKPWVLRH